MLDYPDNKLVINAQGAYECPKCINTSFALVNGRCVPCSYFDPECTSCDSTGCKECNDDKGWVMGTNYCQIIGHPYCQDLDGAGKCDLCGPGAVLINQAC